MRASWPSLISLRAHIRRPAGSQPDKAPRAAKQNSSGFVAADRLGDRDAS